MLQFLPTLSRKLFINGWPKIWLTAAYFLFLHATSLGAEPLPASTQNPAQLRGLVNVGKVYSLAVVTGQDTPALPGRGYSIEVSSAVGEQPFIGENRLTGHDDRVTLSNGVGTQIDGLAHVGIDGIHFGGIKAEDLFHPQGVKRYSTASIPPMVNRGLLLNIAAAKEVPVLPDKYAITAHDINLALTQQELTLLPNDVVLLHTGWMAATMDDGQRYLASSPGLSMAAAKFLAASGVSAVGADNWGVEVVPAEQSAQMFPVHQLLLARHGIYLLENIRTEQLAEDNVDDFLFVLGIPRLEGSVQAVIHPVAID